MKKFLFIIIGLIIALGLMFAAVLNFSPGTIVKATQSSAAKKASLVSKTVMLDGYETHYYEGGSGPTLMLLHGMGDEKNSFVPVAAGLTDKFHVIMPDLMGHGENARDPNQDYSIRGQVEFVKSFADAVGADNFTIGGNSMGGHTSVAYTLGYPSDVNNLIIVNAPGLVLDDHIVYAGFPKKLETEEDLFAIFDRVVYKRPAMPGAVIKYLMEGVNKDFDFLNSMGLTIRGGEDHDLKDRISEISVPTLILWGKHDEVVKFNVAQAYDATIPVSKLVVIEEASHSPQLEKGPELAQEIAAFLKN